LIIFCNNDAAYPDSAIGSTIFQAAIYYLSQMRFLIHKKNLQNWFAQTKLCEGILGTSPVSLAFAAIYDSLFVQNEENYNETNNVIIYLTIGLSIGYIVICYPIFQAFSILFYRDLEIFKFDAKC
jgi:branched-subunit amino acid transport protein